MYRISIRQNSNSITVNSIIVLTECVLTFRADKPHQKQIISKNRMYILRMAAHNYQALILDFGQRET